MTCQQSTAPWSHRPRSVGHVARFGTVPSGTGIVVGGTRSLHRGLSVAVLLTCAGSRADLIALLRDADGPDGVVVACDMRADAPALAAADRAVVVPRVEHPDYVARLLDACVRERVRWLLSLNDFELAILTRHRADFARIGTVLVAPDEDAVEMCLDKWHTFQQLRAWGIPSPHTFLSLEAALDAIADRRLGFPVVVKARCAASSLVVETASNEQELQLVWRLASLRMHRSIEAGASPGMARFFSERPDLQREAVIVQQLIEGPEFGIDAMNDLSGRHIATITREKLVRQGSEALVARFDDRPDAQALGALLSARIRQPGNLNLDAIDDPRIGLTVLDLNPRMGTNYGFLQAVGISIPHALASLIRGERVDEADLKPPAGAVVARRAVYEIV